MHQLQHIVDPLLDVLLADVGDVHRKGDVLVDRHGRDEAEVLKDDAHLAAEIGHFAPAQPGDILAVHEHAALCGQLLPEDELEQGGLACTGVSHQKDELAVCHMEVDVLQRGLVAPLVYLGDMFKIYHEYLAPEKLFGTEVPSLNLSVSLRSTRPGCGSQHPLRALISTRVLLAAAPTMTPCFRHWRRSSLLPLPRGTSGEEIKLSAVTERLSIQAITKETGQHRGRAAGFGIRSRGG